MEEKKVEKKEENIGGENFAAKIPDTVYLGNKGKLPFKNAKWVPIPKEIAVKYRLVNMALEVSDFGAVCTPNGLVKAHPDTVDKWMKETDIVSLSLYTDFKSEVSIRSSKDGPALKVTKTGKEIPLKKIVADTFIENPYSKECIACLNGDQWDVSVKNLMRMTRSEILKFKATGELPEVKTVKPNLMYSFGDGGSFDYGTRIFYIENVTTAEYNSLLNLLNAVGCTAKAPDAAKVYFFIRYWEKYGIHDFSREDLAIHMGLGVKSVSDVIDILINAGLLTYDKELWSKWQGGYEYFTQPFANIFDIGGTLIFSYQCRDTKLGETLICYIKSLKFDVFEPVYKDEWNLMNCTHPEYYYESKYGELKYRYLTPKNNMLERIKESHFVAICVANLKKPFSYTETSGRAYPAFARSKREYRQGFEFEGSPLTELFDIHCSFYTLLTHLLGDSVPEEEKNKYFDKCISGKLYDDCMNFVNRGKRGKNITRDEIKDAMQAWRNDIDGTKSNKKVQEFMEKNYPNIKAVIDNWPVYYNKLGRHKTLQRDCGIFETKLMSKLAYELEDKYNVSCFLLHDAIYVSEKEKTEKLPVDIEEKIINWLRINIL